MDNHSSYDSVKLKLNEKEFVFEDGKWNGEFSGDDIASLLKQNQDLIEENNFLKLKIEMLLNMVAEEFAKNQTRDASQHKIPRL
ncbi:Protein chibby like protein [Argiope bruennichi]|uniref:Protein chibby like protein n=1 Tax=Argiope bruennichi TaxID=94029 RepID=A0A8T0FIK6_ARGBR|nr:Protein chibby like protein [Argiope bruennichi]